MSTILSTVWKKKATSNKQSIATLSRTSPDVVTRQLYFAKKYFILGQLTGEYFNYGHRLTGDKESMTKLIKNWPHLACLTTAALIILQACKLSFLFGFQFINEDRIMDVTGSVGVEVYPFWDIHGGMKQRCNFYLNFWSTLDFVLVSVVLRSLKKENVPYPQL